MVHDVRQAGRSSDLLGSVGVHVVNVLPTLVELQALQRFDPSFRQCREVAEELCREIVQQHAVHVAFYRVGLDRLSDVQCDLRRDVL